MTHPNEALLRQGYAAFGRGDIEGYWRLCTDDFTFHVAGQNRMAGDYRGQDQFFGMVGKVMELTGGQFEETVEDVLASVEHGVVLVRHRFPRNGQTADYQSAHVYDIRDGKLVECWEQPRSQAQFDAAWA